MRRRELNAVSDQFPLSSRVVRLPKANDTPTDRHDRGEGMAVDTAVCAKGTVRWVGRLRRNSSKLYVGVEWDDASRGKHDGCHEGKRLFRCLAPREAPGGGATPATLVQPHKLRPFAQAPTAAQGGRAKYKDVQHHYGQDDHDGRGVDCVIAYNNLQDTESLTSVTLRSLGIGSIGPGGHDGKHPLAAER